ncbi:carbamoyltransferase C-terminal domain-containing protein [Streptomyces sp. B1866]|uniref:carbamoyltransferase family protein n=1 Tax=Streptomyces sp. B1866 TaxID=3075431 RepID=UPI0028927B6C|nr:carbamoyltransferase C-terminal domain-containing protein [Streptomyces sp. B1866]MDT3397623.1 carbamoyltransferase C-terminal domain-containing protein [Streptomyces sp. B1866]
MTVVLGLCAYTHDSAAALLIDGHLVGFVEEERLSGVKHTKEYPRLAVDWLLRKARISSEDVDLVAYNFSWPLYLKAVPRAAALLASPTTAARAWPRARGFATVAARTLRRERALGRAFPRARVRPVVHHRAHQTYAFAASGYEDAAVLVIDSLGETQTTTIAHGLRRGSGRPEVHTLQAIDDPASLGYVYGAVTAHLGWRRGDEEGTVMALAALGDPARFRSLFARALRVTPDGFTVDPGLFPPRTLQPGAGRVTRRFTAATCPPRTADDPVEQVHRDLAAALQERTGAVMLHLARRARDLTGSSRLCLGGGVAANCVGVGAMVEEGIYDEVFVPPAPGDAGTALGAAAAVHLATAPQPLSGVEGACYLGPDYPTAVPDRDRWPGLTVRRLSGDRAGFLADQLVDGRIVGLFQGRAEAGPRALGNRSILASPLSAGVVDRLNSAVKYREPFRPFAPVVPADRAAEYFCLGQEAPFMSVASRVTAQARERIPAVVHANGTARVQTVTPAQNPLLHATLEAFALRTGVPVLINTSLNVKGKPMCGTPEMALDCLAESGLDALLLEDWWVTP